MGLLNRLTGAEQPKLPVHQFQAALFEWELGAVTRADVITAFGITVPEETELDWLKARYLDAVTNGKRDEFKQVVDNVLLLAEQSLFYTNQSEVQTRLVAASGP
jgi:hypothetical protein